MPDPILAAHTTLVALYPSQRPFFDGILEGEGDPASAAHAFGVGVATAILADRAGDPGAGGDYKPSAARGKHRPDPATLRDRAFMRPFTAPAPKAPASPCATSWPSRRSTTGPISMH